VLATLARGLVTSSATLLLRGPGDAGAGQEPLIFDPPQVLVIVGIVVLVLVFAGLVFWRVRRTRSK
jgi:hypothetical protein